MALSSSFFLPSEGDPLPRVGLDTDLETACALLMRHGVLVIENAVTPADLERVDAELTPWFDCAHHGSGKFFGRATRRFSGLLAKAPSTCMMAGHDLVVSIAETVLRGTGDVPVCDAIDLNLTQAIGIEPGEPAQFLHRDDELWPFPRDFEVMVNAAWAVDDFTISNGATRLIPGSHLWARDRQPEAGEAVSAVASKGSVVLWLGGILHGGGANKTQTMRRGMIFSYKLGWLAPAEKVLLSTPPEAARQLPERVQRLLGYQLHRPNLGWIEGQDPLRWLNREFQDIAAVDDNLSAAHEGLLADAQARPELYRPYLV